jgi:Reverse transcriptase (RNA-dependent DNA polymerase)/Pol polyprotein, beta-barrel domain/GAG-pre-integrase domain
MSGNEEKDPSSHMLGNVFDDPPTNAAQPGKDAGSSSSSLPPGASRLSNVSLFDVSLSSLTSPPTLEHSDPTAYQEWKGKFKQWALSVGVWDLVNTSALQMSQQAVDFLAPHGYSPKQAGLKFRALHQRVWGALCSAINGAMGSSLPNSIEAEQKKAGPGPFLEYNANYLWTQIKNTFEKKAGGACLTVLEELMRLSYDRKESPLQLRQRFEALIHKWNIIENDVIKAGERISEGMKYGFLVRALPRSLDTVVQAVTATHSFPTAELLFQALQRNHEVAPGRASAASTGNQSALAFDEEPQEPEQPIAMPFQQPPTRGRPGPRRPGRPRPKPGTDPDPRDGGAREVAFTFLDGAVDSLPLSDADSEDDPYYLPEDELASPLAHILAANADPVLDQVLNTRASELILDSAASKHVVFNANLLEKVQDIEPFHLFAATGHHTTVRKQGQIRLNEEVLIANVCHVPRATHNLASLAVLLDAGAEVTKITKEAIHIRRAWPQIKLNVTLKFIRVPGSSCWKLKLPDSLRKKIEGKPVGGFIRRPLKDPDASAAPPQQALQPQRNRTIPKQIGQQSQTASKALEHVYACLAAEDAAPPHPLEECIESDDSRNIDTILAFHQKETDLARLWHARLGHQNIAILSRMNRLYNLGIPKQRLTALTQCVCDACILAKGRRARIGKTADPKWAATETMDCLHVDLFGPVSSYDGRHKNRVATTLGGNLYGLVMVEAASRTVHVELLKSKDEAADRIIQLIEQWQVQTRKKLKRFHSDGGGEFINDYLTDWLRQNGTRLTYTTANTPQHNGIVERMNGVLMESARAMLVHCAAPLSLWGEAINYAAFIHNNTPQPSIQDQIPYSVLFGRHYEPNKMRTFGCDAFEYLDESVRGKFQPRFRRGIFVGYDATQNGFRVLNPDTRRLIVSRNVKMLENSFKLVRSNVEERDYEALERLIIVPDFGGTAPSQLDAISSQPAPHSSQLAAESAESAPAQPAPEPPAPVDEAEADFADPDPEAKYDDALEQQMPAPSAIPATIPLIDLPSEPAPLAQAMRVSKEAKELHQASQHWFKPSITVPPRKPVGFNSATYSSGIGSVKIVESEPSVSRSGRVSNPIQKKRFFAFIDWDPDALVMLAALVFGGVPTEPKTYKQAIAAPDCKNWEAAMAEELASLERLGTWTVVPESSIPNGQQPITAKWVFKLKLDSNNNPTRYKARLVARGFQQTEGVDYDETFAPVVKLKSLKLILSIAAAQDLEIKQMDFDTAFLNADLSHDVYMRLPEGSNYPPGTVCKLLKSIYGLKQAGHDWHVILRDLLTSLGYEQLQCDRCVFIKRTEGDRMIILPLYVDDTLSVYHRQDEPIWLADKAAIAARYAIKDLGDCEWILNMKLTRDRTVPTITLSQEAYIKRMLEAFRHHQSKPLATPSPDADLFAPPAGCDMTPLDKREQTRYQSIVGSLLYAALTTRPDISFAVNELGRFNAQATQFHMQAAHHVLRYLAGTINLGLTFGLHGSPTDIKPEIYTDSSWANDLETRRSTSGMVVKFSGNIVSWSSRKQKTVAISSTEAEYMAASEATCEALWLRTWIREVFRTDVPVTIYCDNQSAIALAKNDTFHQRTKHIDIRYHLIREHVASGAIQLKFVPTDKQEADILTKRLDSGIAFARQRSRLMTTV